MTKAAPYLTKCEELVLKSILFWHPKAQAKRMGRTWLVKTAQEFLENLSVSYHEETVGLAIRRLAKKGLIELEKHPHPFKMGVAKAYWIRPTGTGPSVTLEPEPTSDWNQFQCHTGTHGTVEQQEEEQEDFQQPPVALIDVSAPISEDETKPMEGHVMIEQDDTPKGVKALKAKAGSSALVIAAMAKGPKTPPVPKAGKPMNPQDAHTALAVFYGETYGMGLGSFNAVRGSMLAKFLERVRGEGLDDVAIVNLLQRLVTEWGAFREWASSMFTLNVKGERPNHQEIVKYAVELVGFVKSTEGGSNAHAAEDEASKPAADGMGWASGVFK